MLIDEKQASQIENALKKQAIVFRPIERDSVVLPAGVANTKQQKNYNFKAFNGKTLNKVLLYKEPLATKYTSATNVGEKVNFVVNGKQILPYDGIDAPNKKLQYLTDAWGVVNTMPGDNVPNFDVTKAKAIVDRVDVTLLNDYVGLTINASVSDLIFKYERTPDDAANIVPMNLMVYGEVNKVVSIDNGEYNIQYL